MIDDAGPDPRLAEDLGALAAEGRITLLRNERNLGFPGTVNRGLALHPDRDVVLLNADTLTAGDWLARLRTAAYSRPDVASVTPFSNDATILSHPLPKEREPASPPPTLDETVAFDAAARTANTGLTIEIPTAVGFCVYLRRDALDETGPLDAESFGRGYGEENDLCLRARRLGLRHLAAADVFVAHVGGRSFGRSKTPLVARNTRVLERLHPGYGAMISAFIHADPLMAARRRIDLVRWADIGARPSILIVTLGLRGGVARFVAERTRVAEAEGRRVLTLFPSPFPDEEIQRNERRRRETGIKDRAGMGRDLDDDGPTGRCRLVVSDRPDLRDLVFRTEEEIDELAGILRTAGVDLVEIHHLLGHSPEVITIPERLGVPYDLFLHDHGSICPRIDLVNDAGRYCGDPDIAECERCAANILDRFDSGLSVTALRERSRRLMSAARRVVAPSLDTAERISRRLFDSAPPPNVVASPWEPDVVPPASRTRPTPPGPRRRVAVIGAIGRQKGFDVLLGCARDAAARDLPLEFVLIGFSDDDARLASTGRIFITGRFSETEAVAFVRAQNADIALLPSISPETWCYALSVAWRAGLPVVAFDLGAVAERIRGKGGGSLLPLSSTPSDVNAKLLSFLDDSAEGRVFFAKMLFLGDFKGARARESVSSPIEQSQSISRREASSMTSNTPPSNASSSGQVQATTQILNLAPGFYSLSVLEGGAAPVAGRIPLPSVQITTVPVPAAGSGVEVLGSLPGGWLARAGDTLVVRVFGALPSNILLTSLKAADRQHENLRLQLTRLGELPATEAPADVAVPPPSPAFELLLHISRQGDTRFPISAWAGVLGQRQWIEAFTVEGVAANAIEYKGLTANGWETAWLPAGELCGSRGMGVPLIGFSFRLKGEIAERFDCVYEGAFVSGRRTAPARNGAPCRSDVIGDPLEGILLRLISKDTSAAAPRII